MTKPIFLFLLLLAAAPVARAQQPGAAPATNAEPQTIILNRNHMQVQAHPAANRPDRAPVYPGGEQALGLFFLERVKYPDAARVKQLKGIVLVNATVNPDGTTSNPTVARSLSPECDAEALRVVALLSGWQPAMRKGRPLPVLVQLPVPFGGAGDMKVEMRNRPQPKPGS